MAATAERSETVELSEHGLAADRADLSKSDGRDALHARARRTTKACSPRAGRSSSTPASTPGRSPKDKFIVRERGSEQRIWWGDVNPELLEERVRRAPRQGRRAISSSSPCSTSSTRSPAPTRAPDRRARVTDSPYHALFAKTLFIDPTDDELDVFEADALVLHAPALEADPEEDGTRSGTFVVLHPTRTEVLIGGTHYAGEIKKSIFTVMNDRLPRSRASSRCTAPRTSTTTAASRSSSGSRGRARRRCPPIRSAG